MKRAYLISCCAVALFILPVSVRAQEDIELGLYADPPAASESKAANEKSVPADVEQVAAGGARSFCKCVGETDSPTVAAIQKALSTRIRSNGLDFTEAPLEQVVTVLEEDYGIPIEVDIPALDEIGIGPDEPVTTSLHGITLRSALRLMLKQLQLSYIVANEVLMITTPEQAEAEIVTCVYDVHDLIGGPKSDPDFGALIEAVIACVSTETWAKNGGGEADVRSLKPGLLVISQTHAVHEEVSGLLDAIRAVRGQVKESGSDRSDDAASARPGDDKVVTRYYTLQLPPATDLDAVLMQIRHLITKSLPDQRWEGRLEDGQSVTLAVLPDRVIVRHTPPTQEAVQALLMESGVANPVRAVGEEMSGGPYGRRYGGGRAGGRYGRGYEGEGGGLFQPRPAQGE